LTERERWLFVPDKHLFKWDNQKTGKSTRNPTFQTPKFLDLKWDKKHHPGEPLSIAESQPMTNRAICFAAALRYRQEQDLKAYAQKAGYQVMGIIRKPLAVPKTIELNATRY
jgi:hypothetical protein